MKRKLVIFAVTLLVMVPLLSGCNIIEPVQIIGSGGGWLPAPGDSLNTGKATFGFTFNIYDINYDDNVLDSYEIKGHLTYIDHLNGVKIIGPVTGFMNEDPGGLTGTFGTEGATFIFSPTDDPDGNDYFAIAISGGDHDGYTNEGPINGGSIQIKYKVD